MTTAPNTALGGGADKAGGTVVSGTLATPSVNSSGYTPSNLTNPNPAGTSIPRKSATYERPDFNTTKAITNNIYQNLMGRNATASEIQQYHLAYVQYAASHPTSTSSSVLDTTSGMAVERNNTSTSTNLSESSFIDNLVNGNAEAKAYTAATTYMDAVQKEINSARGVY